MYSNTNPAELYLGTTWELLTSGKYIQSGSAALQTGGSNSISITKANLPNTKLKVDSFTVSRGDFKIVGDITNIQTTARFTDPTTTGCFNVISSHQNGNAGQVESVIKLGFDSSRPGATSGGFGNASPYTEALGSGSALSIQPSYITLKFWKRLT